jgi:hypothetical protein
LLPDPRFGLAFEGSISRDESEALDLCRNLLELREVTVATASDNPTNLPGRLLIGPHTKLKYVSGPRSRRRDGLARHHFHARVSTAQQPQKLRCVCPELLERTCGGSVSTITRRQPGSTWWRSTSRCSPPSGGYIFLTSARGSSSPLRGLRVVERIGRHRAAVPVDPQMIGAYHLGGIRYDADPYTRFKRNTINLRIDVDGLLRVCNATAHGGSRRPDPTITARWRSPWSTTCS